MSCRFNLEIGAAADGGTEGDQQLGEDRDRVCFGVRRDLVNDLAEQLVVDRWCRRRLFRG
jgi:hypothetical protein